VSWDGALDFAAAKFAALIREHGPDSVAFYISGQLLTEDYYVFNKLAKGLVGTNNVDTNSRLCMSSAVAGYKATLGADAPPACYEDIDAAECIFIAGSNTAFAHPILFRRLEDAKARNPALRLIVVDPRRTDTAAAADLFLPILPGTGRRALQRDAARDAVGGPVQYRLHSRPHRRLRRFERRRARIHAAGRGRHLRRAGGRYRAGGEVVRFIARDVVDVLPGAEPIDAWHA
jgi:formylmethanofuran dehydrogenase subunit B